MMFKNDNLGLLYGTFLGSLFGSGITILVMKKLKKLEEKQFKKEESDAINEVVNYYENKIEKLKNLKISGAASEAIRNEQKIEQKSNQIVNENAAKTHTRPVLDKVIDEPSNQQEKIEIKDIVLTNPKFIIQDENGNDVALDPSDFNEGNNVLEVDRGIRPGQTFDYSRISKEKYTDLSKEYEREPIKLNEVHFPVQITKREYDFNTAYKKVELMYYETNGVFTNMEDEIIEEYREEYFGTDNILKFNTEEASLDGQTAWNELYLRDDALKTDYCIIYTSDDLEKIIGS